MFLRCDKRSGSHGVGKGRARWGVRILGVLVLASSVSSALPEEDRYELRGQVLTQKGRAFRKRGSVAFLQAAGRPFTSWKRLGLDGSFKFKELFPGPYNLTIAVPGAGEITRTVEIGPSFADSKGRIKEEVVFGGELTRGVDHTVSVTDLTVSERAKREYRLAQKRLEEHDVEGAVRHLEEAVEMAPQFAAGWNNLGTIAYHRRDYVEAEDYFRRALQEDKGFYPATLNLGGVLLIQMRPKESLSFNEDAVKVRPGDPLAHSQLGQNYFHLGMAAKAEQHLKRAKALDAGHHSYPQLLLAQIYQLRKDYSASVRELKEFLRFHPDAELVPEVKRRLDRVTLLMRADQVPQAGF